MRFRFLGDVDCPDWLLAEIYNLSQMPSSKIKNLGHLIIKSIKIEEEWQEDKMKKITQDLKLETGELKAIIAALEMIFISSARNSVSPADLSSELQQLGLPREHSAIISRSHNDNCAQITAVLTGQSLKLNKLSSIKVIPYATENHISPFAKVAIKMKTAIGNEKEEKKTINIPKDKLNSLLSELKNVRLLMEQVLR